jgi:hypothetical protein
MLKDNYLDAVTSYWDRICRFLRESRPALTRERTKISIFTRSQFPTAAKLIGDFTTFSVNLGLDILRLPFPSVVQLSGKDREDLVGKLSFRFLFYSDATALKRLRHAMPNRSWLARETLEAETE